MSWPSKGSQAAPKAVPITKAQVLDANSQFPSTLGAALLADTGAIYQMGTYPYLQMRSLGNALVPMSGTAPKVVEVHANSNRTTRCGKVRVPAGQTSSRFSLYGKAGDGGDGSPLGATFSSGGAGSPGECFENVPFPTTPLSWLYYQISGVTGHGTGVKQIGALVCELAATAADATTMTVATGTLNSSSTSNVHAGRVVEIYEGPGAGQIRLIDSNTDSALTPTVPWDTWRLPDVGSKFRIMLASDLVVQLGDGYMTAWVLDGNDGGDGTSSASGAGGAAVGTIPGRTAGTTAAAVTVASNGNNGNAPSGTTDTSPRGWGQDSGRADKLGGASGAGGGFSNTSDGTARTGGNAVNISTLGIEGMEVGQGSKSSGITNSKVAGAPAGGAFQNRYRQNPPAGGGTDSGWAGRCGTAPGVPGAGGATGSPGGFGYPGHWVWHDFAGHAWEAPYSRILYEGPGIEVPSHFLGMHEMHYGAHYTQLTGNQTDAAGRTGRVTSSNAGSENVTLKLAGQLVWRARGLSGTPPAGAPANGVDFWLDPFGPAPTLDALEGSAFSTFGVKLTADGPVVPITTSGSSWRVKVWHENPAGFSYGHVRTLQMQYSFWCRLQTDASTENSTNWASLDAFFAACDADGVKVGLVFGGCPNYCDVGGDGNTPNSMGQMVNAAFPSSRSTFAPQTEMPSKAMLRRIVTTHPNSIAWIEDGNEFKFSATGAATGNGTSNWVGSAADKLQQGADLRAVLVELGLDYDPGTGTGIPLLAGAVAAGSSSFEPILHEGHTGATQACEVWHWLNGTAAVDGTPGHQIYDGITLHPYGAACMANPTADTSGGFFTKADLVWRLQFLREAWRRTGNTDWAKKLIGVSEIGWDASMPNIFSSLRIGTLINNGALATAALGGFCFDPFATYLGHANHLAGRPADAKAVGDFNGRVPGHTLTGAYLLCDETSLAVTEEGDAYFVPEMMI